jgi:hypothetical protein
MLKINVVTHVRAILHFQNDFFWYNDGNNTALRNSETKDIEDMLFFQTGRWNQA